jgi:hypothetical protein
MLVVVLAAILLVVFRAMPFAGLFALIPFGLSALLSRFATSRTTRLKALVRVDVLSSSGVPLSLDFPMKLPTRIHYVLPITTCRTRLAPALGASFV